MQEEMIFIKNEIDRTRHFLRYYGIHLDGQVVYLDIDIASFLGINIFDLNTTTMEDLRFPKEECLSLSKRDILQIINLTIFASIINRPDTAKNLKVYTNKGLYFISKIYKTQRAITLNQTIEKLLKNMDANFF